MPQPRTRRTRRRRLAHASIALALAGAGLSGVGLRPSDHARAALVATGVADTATVTHDRTLVVPAPGVLANDLNLLGGTSAILVSGVSHGTLNLASNGGYTYIPDAGYVGTDTFRYRPSGLLSTAATVTITVANAAPVARQDSYTWPAGTTLVVPAPGVLANDTDADGDGLTPELVGGGISGSFDLDPDGAIRYAPGGGFSGSGSVRYRVWDGFAWSPTATIFLTWQAATPTPTPTPTPRPTPRPTPVPLPSLPLPSLPLPSLPLPSRSPPGGGGGAPVPTARPTPTPRVSDAPASSEPSPRPTSGSGGIAGPGGSAPPSGVTPERPPVRPPAGAPLQGPQPRIDAGGPELEIGIGGIDLLAGIEVWAVPAGTIAVPGLLLLLWVALQAAGALAWIPAVRRLRGEERDTR